MRRIAIVGGGIAGLSAVYFLEKARREGAALEWTLFEKSGRLGGVIRTEQRDGYVLEAGPDSFLTIKPDAAQLCRELGLGDQLIASNDQERKTYIVVNGRLIPLPDGLMFMVPTRVGPMLSTPLFSFATKLKMAAELFLSAGISRPDESVSEFVRRHFGPEMVDRVAEPLLAGVYGGNADQLSVRAVLPRFVEMERESGSLVQATLRARRREQARAKTTAAEGGGSPQPLFTSLRQGMQQMVDALVAKLPAPSLRLNQSCDSLLQSGESWELRTSSGSQAFDAVLLALPAQVSSRLIAAVDARVAEMLGRIHYTSSAAVALAYDSAALPPGHGFLAPRTEKSRMLACTFVHKKFSHRAPEGSALLRCFFSSSRVPELLNYDDKTLIEIARKELIQILGLRESPRFGNVFRWACALPQYDVGHLERVAEMEQRLTNMPGLAIIGNSFHGIGVPDCIRSARLAAAKIVSSTPQPASV